jgi:hypothetical protein
VTENSSDLISITNFITPNCNIKHKFSTSSCFILFSFILKVQTQEYATFFLDLFMETPKTQIQKQVRRRSRSRKQFSANTHTEKEILAREGKGFVCPRLCWRRRRRPSLSLSGAQYHAIDSQTRLKRVLPNLPETSPETKRVARTLMEPPFCRPYT